MPHICQECGKEFEELPPCGDELCDTCCDVCYITEEYCRFRGSESKKGQKN